MNDIRDSAQFVTREPRSGLALATLRDGVSVADMLASSRVWATVRDGAAVGDSADGRVSDVLRAVGTIADAAHPHRVLRVDIREGASLNDAAAGSRRVTADLRESAPARDVLHAQDPAELVVDSIRVGDVVLAQVARRAAIREGARVAGRAQQLASQDARATARATDTASPRVAVRSVVRDQGSVGDTAAALLRVRQTTRDTVGAGDSASPRVRHAPTVRERGFVAAHLRDMAAHAWTAELAGFGMSRYTDVPFDSMAGGFAAGPGGLYRPTEAPVPWVVRTGKLDFGTGVRKRLSQIYMMCEHDEPLAVTVEGDHNGVWLMSEYVQMPRDASDLRVVRCAVGRGYCGNAYVVAVSGERPFALHWGEALVHKATRRI